MRAKARGLSKVAVQSRKLGPGTFQSTVSSDKGPSKSPGRGLAWPGLQLWAYLGLIAAHIRGLPLHWLGWGWVGRPGEGVPMLGSEAMG